VNFVIGVQIEIVSGIRVFQSSGAFPPIYKRNWRPGSARVFPGNGFRFVQFCKTIGDQRRNAPIKRIDFRYWHRANCRRLLYRTRSARDPGPQRVMDASLSAKAGHLLDFLGQSALGRNFCSEFVQLFAFGSSPFSSK